MADTFKLELLTPEKDLLGEAIEVEEVTAPGFEGEFGVLPGHAPYVTLLGVGPMSYRKGGETVHFAVNKGYAEVGQDHVRILTETSEAAGQIDAPRAETARDRAQERLGKIGDESIDVARAKVALKRALTRLHVAKQI